MTVHDGWMSSPPVTGGQWSSGVSLAYRDERLQDGPDGTRLIGVGQNGTDGLCDREYDKHRQSAVDAPAVVFSRVSTFDIAARPRTTAVFHLRSLALECVSMPPQQQQQQQQPVLKSAADLLCFLGSSSQTASTSYDMPLRNDTIALYHGNYH